MALSHLSGTLHCLRHWLKAGPDFEEITSPVLQSRSVVTLFGSDAFPFLVFYRYITN